MDIFFSVSFFFSLIWNKCFREMWVHYVNAIIFINPNI